MAARRLLVSPACAGPTVQQTSMEPPYGAQVTTRQLAPNLWTYTLYNVSTVPDYRLSGIALYAPPWSVANAVIPSGWDAYWSGKDGGFWVGGPPDGQPAPVAYVVTADAALAPGQALRGFEFRYEVAVDSSEIVGSRWDACFSSAGGLSYSTGYLMSEENVPEPSSALALAMAVVSLVGLSAATRKRGGRMILVAVTFPALLAVTALADDQVSLNSDPRDDGRAVLTSSPMPVSSTLPSDFIVLPAFPRFWWSYGCMPTSGAMMVGYYDNAGFPDMVRKKLGSSDATAYYQDYDTEYGGAVNDNQPFLKTGDDPYLWRTAAPYGSRCAISASEQDVWNREYRGHVDYYVGVVLNPDPYYQQNWPAHTDDSVADFMCSNIWYWRGNGDGISQAYFLYATAQPNTWQPPSYPYPNPTSGPPYAYVDATYGLARYVATHAQYYCTTRSVGGVQYDDVAYYANQPIKGYQNDQDHLGNGVVEQDIVDEIDAGRPIIAIVCKLVWNSGAGKWYESSTWHAFPIFGYRKQTGQPLQMLAYDTWREDWLGYETTTYRIVSFPNAQEIPYHSGAGYFERKSPNPDEKWKIFGFSFLKIDDYPRCDAPLADGQTEGDTVHDDAFDLVMTGQGESGRQAFSTCTKVRWDHRDPGQASEYVSISNGTATLHIDKDCYLCLRTYKDDAGQHRGYIASK
ncbi:MAG: hypothetical protein M1274_06725, partial [Actinobacteria bacterium]|nr:hypothetical protein [Actinomycetota bacterium]